MSNMVKVIDNLMDQVIDLEQYAEGAVARRYEVDAVLTGIHGEHDKRVQLISEIAFDETRETTNEDKKTSEKTRLKKSRPESIHTFPRDDDGNYLVPLGGAHGYILGALRTAIKNLYKDKLNNKTWEGYGISTYINNGLHVAPQWVSVGKKLSHEPSNPMKHMVITAGISKSMMPVYYDYVERAEVHLTLELMNEKIPESILLSLLAYVQRLGLGPKGRGTLRITKVVKTK